MSFNPTKNTFQQVANKHAYDMASSGNLNSKTFITTYDPIYNKLIQQISYTIYRKMRVVQKWRELGANAPKNAYPGILREVYMTQRKGRNFAMDNGTRPTQLGAYDIVDDTIDVRYHAAQFRWSYPWTIYDEELRAYSGGNGTMIGELAEMKMINCTNARNMFMDSLRKQTLKNLIQNVAIHLKPETTADPRNFTTLTSEGAREWLNWIDNILFEMEVGSALYNVNKQYMQVPKNDLVMVMPRALYMNLIRKAYPDMFNNESYMNIFPGNLILIDTLGGEMLLDGSGSEVATPTFDDNGMNLLNWDTDSQWKDELDGIVGVIMHRDAMGFEDNLDEVLFGMKDIERLATPARAHFWTKAYITDIVPSVALEVNGG